MIGGEHYEPLTGALLRDWAYQGFSTCFPAWVESLGGKYVCAGGSINTQAEETQADLKAGRPLPTKQEPDLPLRWDKIAVAEQQTPSPNPRWVWMAESMPPKEPVTLYGPKGGERKTFRLGWHYLCRYNTVPTKGFWTIPTNVEGVGRFRNNSANEVDGYPESYYVWLGGYSHVVTLFCSLDSLADTISRDELFANIVAHMFNSALEHIELATVTEEAATVVPDLPKFDKQIARQKGVMAERISSRQEEMKARIAAIDKDIVSLQKQAEVCKKRIAPLKEAPDLQECLKAILDAGLCSAIKQDLRGLWFLFDDIHAVVSPKLAQRGTEVTGERVIPGIYKLVPAIIHLPWDAKGSQWVCGTLDGGIHPNRHVNVSGAFRKVCFGSKQGALGPEGVDNATWFDILWDENPVEWAKAIHAFMRQTNFEYNPSHYPGIWTCGTLVTSHEPKLTVTKLPTPTLTVTRTRPAEELPAEGV